MGDMEGMLMECWSMVWTKWMKSNDTTRPPLVCRKGQTSKGKNRTVGMDDEASSECH